MTVSTSHNYKTEKVLFSVIIPCFNSERSLARCLDSVVHQSLTPHEVLVFDDASTDGSKDIIRYYAEKYEYLKALYSAENKGAGHARNELLKICSGNFVAFLDSDDYWLPKKLELQKKLIEETSADIVGCKIRLLSQNGETIGFRNGIKPLTRSKLLRFNHIGMSGAVVSLKLKFSRDMPKLRKRQDYAYFLGIFNGNTNVKFDYCNTELVHYIRTSSGLSGESRLDKIKFNYIVLRKYGRLSRINAALHIIIHIINRLRVD